MTEKRGKYIVIEGGEGCGKTIQAELLYQYLQEKDIPCFLGREPGGISSAEEMREILKHNAKDISAIGEVFGFEFARAEFFDKIVSKKLEEGIAVLSDRSGYSTIAYQGFGGGVDVDWIKSMNQMAMRGVIPDLAFVIDIDFLLGLEKEVIKDRFSKKEIEYHQRVRQGFLQMAKENPYKCRVIPYIPNEIDKMQRLIRVYVDELFDIKSES
jgi:dTMP kinase